MPRFDLNLLQALDALLEEKSVTAAAEIIGVSQPAMSGMLGRLREQLHDPLLVRVGNQLECTPRGEQLRPGLRQALLAIEGLLRADAGGDLSRTTRHVRIMASDNSQLTILPELFARARSEMPNVTFEVVPMSDPLTGVLDGSVDICLSGVPLGLLREGDAELLRRQTILNDRFVALVDRDHALDGSASVEDMLRFPRVATRFPGITQNIEDQFLPAEMTGTATITVPSFFAGAAILPGTTFIYFAPERLARLICDQWGVKVLKVSGDFRSVPLNTLWHSRFAADRVHIWIRTTLFDICAGIRKAQPSEHVA